MQWRLADAKNRLSELVNRALEEGPQFIQRRDDSVVVVSRAEYDKLTTKRPSLVEFLTRPGPSMEGLDLTRDRTPMRVAELPGSRKR